MVSADAAGVLTSKRVRIKLKKGESDSLERVGASKPDSQGSPQVSSGWSERRCQESTERACSVCVGPTELKLGRDRKKKSTFLRS